ncbi:hypothetical protein DSO57_1014395 [Entomophthora muscae]|uniref:Uncharacterized protein n=1 Tax=Entomophthora muscae TaxID=34485 RepID=A0ACC2TG62_9FUNG|nr:hypothetical protein DSO57_1014395 [Entomophthora muscae]
MAVLLFIVSQAIICIGFLMLPLFFSKSSANPPAPAQAVFSTKFQLTKGSDVFRFGEPLVLAKDMVWIANSSFFTETHALSYAPAPTCYRQAHQGIPARICEVEASRHFISPPAILLPRPRGCRLRPCEGRMLLPRPQYPSIPFRDATFAPIFRMHTLHKSFVSRATASKVILNMHATRLYWKPIHLVVVGHREINYLNGANQTILPFHLTFSLTLDSGLQDGAVLLENQPPLPGQTYASKWQ